MLHEFLNGYFDKFAVIPWLILLQLPHLHFDENHLLLGQYHGALIGCLDHSLIANP